MKVALVCMPFQNFALPSLGLGLLQTSLRREGFICDVHYLNLRFARRIGCISYLTLGVNSPQYSLCGEWLFAAELFGGDSERDCAYIERILKQRSEKYFHGTLLRRLLAVRRCVPDFLEECAEHIPWGDYDVVGFTSTFQQNVASLGLAQRLKAAFPDKTVIFGGANCEGEMGIELHRQFPFIDFVCSGEGDRAFPELMRRLRAGEDTSGIAGIISRAGGETIVPREIVSPIFDLDKLPYPCFEDYFAQLDEACLNRRFAPSIPYETSRGCWWGAKMHCTFCGLNGATMAYRCKTPQRAWEELMYLGKTYGTRIHCTDNIIDLKYLDSFFPRIPRVKPRFSMQCETKVNLTRAQLQVLRGAGVKKLQPGIESLSSPILRLMKKGCNLLQVVQFLKWCRQLGIHAIWNVLYGFPGESAADYDEMARVVPLLSHLEPPGDMGRIRLDRFSPYFARPAEHGFQNVRPRAAYTYIYPFEQEIVGRIAYSFDADHAELDSVEDYVRPLMSQLERWQTGRRGSLKGNAENGRLVIADTRRGRRKTTTVLEEPLKSAYIFCDQSRPFSAVQAHLTACFGEKIVSDACLAEGLDDLVARGLMLKEGKSFLSLAVLSDGDEFIDSPGSAGLLQVAALPLSHAEGDGFAGGGPGVLSW